MYFVRTVGPREAREGQVPGTYIPGGQRQPREYLGSPAEFESGVQFPSFTSVGDISRPRGT